MTDLQRMQKLAGIPITEAVIKEGGAPSKADKDEYAEMRIAELKKGGTKFPIKEMSEEFFKEIVAHAFSYGWMDGVAQKK